MVTFFEDPLSDVQGTEGMLAEQQSWSVRWIRRG